jgi:hypothetical protein
MARLPTYIVAGAMRCGTTALNSYLREHPDIAVSSSKEVHFFDEKWDLGLDWYMEQFPYSDKAVAVGEATPNYMFRPFALDRLRDTLPDVKLVLMLRNPADRAYSHYWHDRSRGKTDGEFADVAARELAGEDIGPAAYLDRGRYRWQIEEMLKRFPREALHVQAFEDMKQDPVRVYSEICEFIGVDASFRPERLGAPVNAYTEFRSLKVRDLARRLPKRAQNLVAKLNRKEAAGYPPMEPAIREKINAEFAAANAGLDDLVGRTLPEWR